MACKCGNEIEQPKRGPRQTECRACKAASGLYYWSADRGEWCRRRKAKVENVANCRACGVEFRRVGVAKKRCNECAAKSRLRSSECIHCKNLFPARSKRDRFCSASCAQQSRWSGYTNRVCKNCNDAFHKTWRGPGNYCSLHCRDEAKKGCEYGLHVGVACGAWLNKNWSAVRICPHCDTSFTTQQKERVYCSRECGIKASSARHLDVGWGWFVCGCGEVYERTRDAQCQQCWHCNHKAKRQRKRTAKARRRLRVRTAPCEAINAVDVYESEDWKCYICNCDCIEWPGFACDEAATLDHVIPLAKGGSHTRDNVRCCCFRCNSHKGDAVSSTPHQGAM